METKRNKVLLIALILLGMILFGLICTAENIVYCKFYQSSEIIICLLIIKEIQGKREKNI